MAACYSRGKKDIKGCGSCVQRAQDFIQSPEPHKPGVEVIVHVYKPSTKDLEAGESQVQGDPQLHNKLKANKGGGISEGKNHLQNDYKLNWGHSCEDVKTVTD